MSNPVSIWCFMGIFMLLCLINMIYVHCKMYELARNQIKQEKDNGVTYQSLQKTAEKRSTSVQNVQNVPNLSFFQKIRCARFVGFFSSKCTLSRFSYLRIFSSSRKKKLTCDIRWDVMHVLLNVFANYWKNVQHVLHVLRYYTFCQVLNVLHVLASFVKFCQDLLYRWRKTKWIWEKLIVASNAMRIPA